MTALFGSWIGTGAAGTWTPRIDPALVDDPRFPALLAANKAGASFAGAVAIVTGASDANSIGYAIARNLMQGGAQVVITGSRDLLEIPLSWQKPAVYRCDFQNRTCPEPAAPAAAAPDLGGAVAPGLG